jgi:hypothetical protein
MGAGVYGSYRDKKVVGVFVRFFRAASIGTLLPSYWFVPEFWFWE